MDLKELELKRLKDKGYDTTHLGCVAYDGLTIIASALEEGIDLGDIPKPGIDNFQIRAAIEGIEKGYDKKYYDASKFDGLQMACFNDALNRGINPEPFMDPKYDYHLMKTFTNFIEEGKDITPVLDERIPINVMKYMLYDSSHNEQIYELLEQSWSKEQLCEICYGFYNGVDPTPYITLLHNVNCIHLVIKTLSYGLDPTCMAKPGFDEAQIENLFFGLLGGYDVSKYADPSISYFEMIMYERVYGYMRENNITDFEEAYNSVRDLQSIPLNQAERSDDNEHMDLCEL